MEIRQLTFLRFVAAAGVVLFHARKGTPALAFGRELWDVANTAVSFFFVLSGFILAFVYCERGLKDKVAFFVARFARIAPIYWLALLAVVPFALRAGTLALDELVLGALMLQAWLPGYAMTLNEPGWSLSVEALFYFTFPFLLSPLRRLSLPVLIVVATAAWSLCVAAHVFLFAVATREPAPWVGDLVFYHPLGHLGTFVLGIAAGLVFRARRASLARVAVPLMVGSTALFLAFVFLPNGLIRFHHNGLLAPIFVAFIWGLGSNEHTLIARVFSRRPLVWLGEISYAIYILQFPLFLAFATIAGRLPRHDANVRFAIWFFVLIAISGLTYRFIEVPLRGRIKALYDGRLARRAPVRA